MVGRILGLLPCLAGIPAALELQSIESVYGAVAELLPGALHNHTRPPNAGNTVAPQHLSSLSKPAQEFGCFVCWHANSQPAHCRLLTLTWRSWARNAKGCQVWQDSQLWEPQRSQSDRQGARWKPSQACQALQRKQMTISLCTLQASSHGLRPCKAGRTMKIVVRLTCKSMGSDIGREPGNPSGQPADMSSC